MNMHHAPAGQWAHVGDHLPPKTTAVQSRYPLLRDLRIHSVTSHDTIF